MHFGEQCNVPGWPGAIEVSPSARRHWPSLHFSFLKMKTFFIVIFYCPGPARDIAFPCEMNFFRRNEQTPTKRPRLPGREKQTPKTCAHERRKEDAEKKMEDQRARLVLTNGPANILQYFAIACNICIFFAIFETFFTARCFEYLQNIWKLLSELKRVAFSLTFNINPYLTQHFS